MNYDSLGSRNLGMLLSWGSAHRYGLIPLVNVKVTPTVSMVVGRMAVVAGVLILLRR